MLDLNEIIEVCKALNDRLGSQEWTVGGLDWRGLHSVYDGDGNRWFTGVEERAQFIARARTWLPALVKELEQARAERDTLSALVPLYRAVDDYLYKPDTNDYPVGHCNPDQLEALREVFREMSADAMADEEANDAQSGDD